MKKALRVITLLIVLIIDSTAQVGWIEINGISYQNVNPPSFLPTVMAGNSNYLFTTQAGGFLYRSADHGDSWTNVGSGSEVSAAIANEAHLFIAQNIGPSTIRCSDNNGNSWSSLGNIPFVSGQNNKVSALAIMPNYLFVATWGGKCYKRALYELAGVTPTAAAAVNIAPNAFDAGWSVSTGDLGYCLDVATDDAFTALVEGYNNKDVGNVTSFRVTGLSAATTYYYRMRAYNVNGTSENSNTVTLQTSAPSAVAPATLPTATGLNANYPNPFNPTTTISYQLLAMSNVHLAVYNAQGEVVKILVKEIQNAGNHSIDFDGAGLNSGTYFYKLEVDGKQMVNKMVMVK